VEEERGRKFSSPFDVVWKITCIFAVEKTENVMIKKNYKTKVTDKYVFFMAGPLGNWYFSPLKYDFDEEGVQSFISSEHMFMYWKAIYFRDFDTADRILDCGNSKEAKRLGREVKGFNGALWDKAKRNIMEDTLIAKYYQCEDFRNEVNNPEYEGKTFVEANPNDTVWSCGLSMDNPGIEDETNWRGENLLGEIITHIRETMNPKSKKNEKRELLDKFNGMRVKITIKANSEVPFIHGTYIAMLSFSESVGNYTLRYPRNIYTGAVDSAESNFDNNDTVSIEEATEKEKRLWATGFIDFRTSCDKFKHPEHFTTTKAIEIVRRQDIPNATFPWVYDIISEQGKIAPVSFDDYRYKDYDDDMIKVSIRLSVAVAEHVNKIIYSNKEELMEMLCNEIINNRINEKNEK
jgi:hypothetical protein